MSRPLISGSQGSTSRCPPSGRAVNCPARVASLPPRLPAEAVAIVVGLRLAPRGPSGRDQAAQQVRCRRPDDEAGAAAAAASRSPGIRPRPRRWCRGAQEIAPWRAGGAAGAPDGWSGCPGCGRAQGRCGRYRVRRGEDSRVGLGRRLRGPARRGRALGSPEAEQAPWQSWRRGRNLRPRVPPAPRGAAGRTARSRGRAACLFPAAQPWTPAAASSWQHFGGGISDTGGEPLAFGVWAKRASPEVLPASSRAPFYFHRVGFPHGNGWCGDVRWATSQCVQSNPSHERPVGGCSESAALFKPKDWEMLQFEFGIDF